MALGATLKNESTKRLDRFLALSRREIKMSLCDFHSKDADKMSEMEFKGKKDLGFIEISL